MLIYILPLCFLCWFHNYETRATEFSDKIDSLTQLLKNTDSQNQSRLYNLLAWNLRNSNVELSFEYATNALHLARKYMDAKNIVFGLNTLGLLSTFQNKNDRALYYFKEEIKIASENNLEIAEANAYNNIGNIHYRQSLFDSAMQHYKEAETRYTKIKLNKSLARSQINIGLIHFELGNYSNALDHYFKALKVYQSDSSYLIGKGALLNNIGNVYFHLFNYDKAYSYYNKSIEINLRTNDQRRLCSNLLMASRTTRETKKYKNSHQLIDSAIIVSEKLADHVLIFECLLSKASIFIAEGEPDNASETLSKCEKLMLEVKNNVLQSEFHLIEAAVLMLKEQYLKANYSLVVALKKARTAKSANLMALIQRKLFSVNMRLQNYETAGQNVSAYLKYSDSLINENVLQVINSQQKYEDEKINKELVSYKYRNDKLANDAERNEIWLIVVLILMIALIAFSVLWYFYNLSEKRSMALINKVNEEIHHEKIQNLSKNHELEYIKAKFEGEEKERSRIAKELHDGIGGTIGVIRLMLTDIGGKNVANEINSVMSMLDNAYEEVRSISRDLSPLAIRKKSFLKLIKNFIFNLGAKAEIKVNLIAYPPEKINELEEDLKIDIYRISQELMTNVVKHSKADEITFQFIVHEDYINLLFEDNGSGFSPSEDETGIGLLNIESRIKAMCGNIDIDTQPEAGTLVNINIPYKKPSDQ